MLPRAPATKAWDSKAELRLSRKRKEAKVVPWVRSPGLLGTQRCLGDLRLECKVQIAIVKEEMPFWVDALVDSLILTATGAASSRTKTATGRSRCRPG